VRLLERFAARAGRLSGGRRPAAEWRGGLKDLLDAVGWPGQRGLDSEEHQQLEALGAVLDALSGLDAVCPQGLTYEQVLGGLERSVGETLFQPESAPDAPIQVMGPLEAAGQVFDGVWVLGLDEAHWPVLAHPNPFLSYALQRDRGMPNASPERELAYARRLTDRLLGSGRVVGVSHPLREGDAECTPSPLIAGLDCVHPTELGLDPEADASLAACLAVGTPERFDDERETPLDMPADLAGGSAVLADQAACPFRAFARHRLGADEPETVAPGLDAATFGSLVHRILEVVWSELGDSTRLATLAAEEISGILSRAVDGALAVWQGRLADVLTPGFSALLRERLLALVEEWLEIERQRAPFEVLAREQEEHVDLGGLGLGLKVDCIDELEDGSRIVLDYKTGKSASAGSWDRDRLEEPQLPLYAVAVAGGLSGLALAKVRRDGHRGFEGAAIAAGCCRAAACASSRAGPRGWRAGCRAGALSSNPWPGNSRAARRGSILCPAPATTAASIRCAAAGSWSRPRGGRGGRGMSRRPADQLARERALDPEHSFIVQAPAGSGKTELLTRRFLRLLAIVEVPEEIVAITFTRKAAAEMRHRILGALELADGPEPETAHGKELWRLGGRARARDAARGWQLMSSPARLRVQTIDSLCAALARQMPLLSGLGAVPEVTEDADALYRDAALRTLAALEDTDGMELARALGVICRHLDGNLGKLEELLIAQLARRDHDGPAGAARRRRAFRGGTRRRAHPARDAL